MKNDTMTFWIVLYALFGIAVFCLVLLIYYIERKKS